MLTRLFNKSAADTAMLGDKTVRIPKLTPERWKAMFERIETLPQLLIRVLSERHSDDFVATAIVGANMAMDEAIQLVAVLAEVEAEYIEKHADLNEITDFIRLTLEKNDLQRTIKNFRAVLGQFQAGLSGGKTD